MSLENKKDLDVKMISMLRIAGIIVLMNLLNLGVMGKMRFQWILKKMT